MATNGQKFDHVSLYLNGKTRRWELAYKLGGRRRVERLGYVEAHARQRAKMVSTLIDRHKSRLLDGGELSRLVRDRQPAEKHLDSYVASLKANGRDEKYRSMMKTRVKSCFEALGATRLDHLDGRVGKLVEKLRSMDGRRGKKFSPQTINHYLRAMRQFLNWCRKPAQGLLTGDPMVGIAGVRVEDDLRHPRRPPTAQEMQVLLAWVEQQKPGNWRGSSGADRAMFYRLLYGTGLRSIEARRLITEYLDLGDELPAVKLPAKITKNRKDCVLPLPRWLAESLKTWLGQRNGRLFSRMSNISHTFEDDLFRAREHWIAGAKDDPTEQKRRRESGLLKRRTEHGVFDLHSFRHGYVTALVSNNVNVKDAQTLARHADPKLTIGRYAHASADLQRHVDLAIGKV